MTSKEYSKWKQTDEQFIIFLIQFSTTIQTKVLHIIIICKTTYIVLWHIEDQSQGGIILHNSVV